jgi:hypothetical protein
VSNTTRNIGTVLPPDRVLQPGTREIYALIVGVGRFRQNDIPLLHGARNDAEDFHNLLIELGVPRKNINVLTDDGATHQRFHEALRELPNPDIAVLVYIATHGAVFRSRDGSELGFLLLHDSQVYGAFPKSESPYLTERPDAISTDEFLSQVHTAKGDRKLIAIDACYAGTARWVHLRNAGGCLPSYITQVLCACGSRELAYESHNGRFTAAMMQALRELWIQGKPFLSSEVHYKINKIFDSVPHLEKMQKPQIFTYAGEWDFCFYPPSAQPSVPLGTGAQRDRMPQGAQFGHHKRASEPAGQILESIRVASDEYVAVQDGVGSLNESIQPTTRELRHQRHWDGLEYVQLPSGVWLSQTLVTVAAYWQVMKTRRITPRFSQALREPIVGLPLQVAREYCAIVGGRLPSREEWVSAARVHPQWCYPWGNDISAARAQYRALTPCEVGKFEMTSTGFYDIVGNVWEWCGDSPRRGSARIVGGSFQSSEGELCVDFVSEKDPSSGHDDVGFRCLLEKPPVPRP